jgi:4-diphosphocytidyl-2-C-methyl-D-erythritol kinase
MKIRAYAKINLGLYVLGKRPDGYHSIETVFRLVDLCDEIEIVQIDQGTQFTTNAVELQDDHSNLCVRAANLLRDLTGIHVGVEINLTKRIPIGAGLGGGSSDAAAVLKGLTKLWALDISREELQTVSASLGSDVPFFFTSQTASATGRGEVLESFDLKIPYTILLVTPNIHVSTSWAYSHLWLRVGTKRPDLRQVLEENLNDPERLREYLVNDFEETVFEQYPEISSIKQRLLSEGASFALMSGSGSSVFGLFTDSSRAKNLAKQLAGTYAVSVTDPEFNPLIN